MEEVQATSPEALAALPRAALNPRNVAANNVRMSRAKFDAQHPIQADDAAAIFVTIKAKP
jgi:hypothetical protein